MVVGVLGPAGSPPPPRGAPPSATDPPPCGAVPAVPPGAARGRAPPAGGPSPIACGSGRGERVAYKGLIIQSQLGPRHVSGALLPYQGPYPPDQVEGRSTAPSCYDHTFAVAFQPLYIFMYISVCMYVLWHGVRGRTVRCARAVRKVGHSPPQHTRGDCIHMSLSLVERL